MSKRGSSLEEFIIYPFIDCITVWPELFSGFLHVQQYDFCRVILFSAALHFTPNQHAESEQGFKPLLNLTGRKKNLLTSPLFHLSKTESITILQNKTLYTIFLLFLWKNMKGWRNRSTLYRFYRRIFPPNELHFCIGVTSTNDFSYYRDWKITPSWSLLFILAAGHKTLHSKQNNLGILRKERYTQKAQPQSDASVKHGEHERVCFYIQRLSTSLILFLFDSFPVLLYFILIRRREQSKI